MDYDYKDRALGILRETGVFDEDELDFIIEVASPDAMEDMGVLCGSPELLGWFKANYLRKEVPAERRNLFLEGFFGTYKRPADSATDPKAVFWNQNKKARAYPLFAHLKPFNFGKLRTNSSVQYAP